ncbi:MAG: VRR-NUC domain-containing protein [Methanoregulaceae archaeon]|nr:VRR-NUC domain-containing protein [Methanoregulaceae archaeon]
MVDRSEAHFRKPGGFFGARVGWHVHTFELAHVKWWNKQLILVDGAPTVAELGVLAVSLRKDERGVWLNASSRKWMNRPSGKHTGVIGLARDASKPSGFSTIRAPIPEAVIERLIVIYSHAGIARGCPDLVLWDERVRRIRLIEVKCPLWDRLSADQVSFLNVARALGIDVEIREWRPS